MKNNYFVALDSEHIYGFKDYQQAVQLGVAIDRSVVDADNQEVWKANPTLLKRNAKKTPTLGQHS